MTADRFEERRRGERRLRRIRWALAALVVVVACGLVWLVWFSSLLSVRTVEIDGLKTLEASEVRDQADIDMGEPLVRVDTVEIEARVAALERVERVTVSREWPRTVRIRVAERTAVAWVRDSGEIRGVDRYGIDFRSFEKKPDDLYELRLDIDDPEGRQRALEAAASVVTSLRTDAPELDEQVHHVDVSSQDDIVLRLDDDRSVTWGSAAKTAEKLRVLEPLLELDAREYDVSAPEQPTTKD